MGVWVQDGDYSHRESETHSKGGVARAVGMAMNSPEEPCMQTTSRTGEKIAYHRHICS